MTPDLTRGEQALVDLATVTQVATVNHAVQSSRNAVNKLETLLADADQVTLQSEDVSNTIATHVAKIRQSLTAITDAVQQ